jgi:recombination protein RecT
MSNNQLQVSEQDVGRYLESVADNLTGYGANNFNAQHFAKSAMLAIVESEDLTKCIATKAGKASLYHALRYGASTGLSLNPQEGKAALIPRGGKVQYWIMKNGMIDLAMQTGKVSFITCDTVREGDAFTIKKTMDGDVYEFAPARKDRGKIDGYFAAVKLSDGTTHVKYMTAVEVAEHRAKYSAKSQMPEEGYGLKTVMKSMLRNVNITPELSEAIGMDDKMEFGMRDVTAAEDLKSAMAEADEAPDEPAGIVEDEPAVNQDELF